MIRKSKLAFGALLALSPSLCWAADVYPSRTLTFVLPNATGGSAEATARIIGDAITALTHQAVLVEPKPGAAGNLAASYVLHSKPDGYTLFFSFMGTHGINANVYKHLQYSPMGDFKPITVSWKAPFFLYVRKNAPFHTIKELIDYAKANPGKLSFATAGKTDPTNIELLLFDSLAGIQIVGVPYKGIGDTVQDVAAGRIDGTFATIATGLQFARAGQVNLIGQTFNNVLPDYPKIPPISATVPGFQFTTWDGVMAPAATPDARVKEINVLVQKVLAEPEVVERFRRLGLYVAATAPQEMADMINSDTDRIGKALRQVGVTPQ